MRGWQRRRMLQGLAGAVAGSAAGTAIAAGSGSTCAPADHLAWVTEALKRMQTIAPGMTRNDLMRVFTTEGGLSTPFQRTFVSRDCPYFKVDATFRRASQRHPEEGRERLLSEYGDDVIATVSRPFLQFSIMD